MLRGEFPAAGGTSPEELRASYLAEIVETIERVGPETVLAESDVDESTVDSLLEGGEPTLELADAAALLATDPDRPDAAAIAAEARDILLLGMTTAVLDVDTLASGLDGTMEPKDIQQKVEGRQPMTLGEYAQIHNHLEGQTA